MNLKQYKEWLTFRFDYEGVNCHRLKSVASPLAHCIANKSPFGVLHNGGDTGWFTGVTRVTDPAFSPASQHIAEKPANLYPIWSILGLWR